MAFKSNFLLFVILSMVVVASTFCHVFAVNDDQKLLDSFEHVHDSLAPSPSHGDWHPIEDTSDPKVVDVAKFAVSTENSRAEGRELIFESVSNGKFQVDNKGITYRLAIVTTEFDVTDEYLAVVFENSKDNVRKLISFT
ncbi:cysteine proteinase inhibitor 6-like [Lycium barbarum]|uniref:cysteine proteinase inhibitor 6-like n=1 Tax=Lycium barbarum TaxID=112863 RepID=UPI00293E162D|nr:cysteine proteinase inhibitor 6-like [Lycium barbarum]